MTSRGDLRLMLTDLYPSKDPVPTSPNTDDIRRSPPYRSRCIPGHGRSPLCVRSGRDATRLSGIPTTVYCRIEYGCAPKAFVYESFGQPKNVKYKTSGRFPAKRSKLCSLTTLSARGRRFRQEWRLRSALISKCGVRGLAGDSPPSSSRPRSQQVRRSSPAAECRAHKYPYPPKSSPLFGPARGVGRERIFHARQPPKLREPRFLWLLNVVRPSRDRDRQTEI